MIVRDERPADRNASLEVERVAFPDEDMVSIVRALREREDSFALVAEEDATIVGHVQLSRGWVGEAPVVVLGPVGVHPDLQRRGIGGALVRAALEEARSRGEVAVILLGDPAYYGRFGFVPGSSYGLRNPAVGVTPDGFEILEEHFQIAPLDERASSLSGAVRWDPALNSNLV